MAGDLPPAPGQGPATGPPPSPIQWGAPPFPMQQPPRPRAWSATVLAAVAVLLGAAALVVALTRSPGSLSAGSTSTATAPSYTAQEAEAAHQKLCDVYKVAARSVDIDTNTDNRALAGAVSVNAAVMLEQVVSAAPAMSSGDRAAALTLAAAYTRATAMGSALQRDDPQFRSEVDDVNAKDAAMKKICGGA